MGFITNLLEGLFMNFLFGEEILGFVDNYFINQSDLNQILIVIGVGVLSVLGLISLIKHILKKTAGLLKVVLIFAVLYYVIIVLLGVDIWGMIFK
ncbi:hypothetical protein KHQ82_02535 [Mycoplasmatota bacterium]|nr:hypothetical protein KHQ82_02535 [Mycoplasmatota bacterium]